MTAMPPLDLWGDSHPGRQRANNEDCIYIALPKQAAPIRRRPPVQSAPVTDTRIADRGVLLIVADGVGGGSVGQVASRFVVDIVAETFYKGVPSANAADDLRQGLERANAAIQNYVIGSNIQTPVASTGTAALVEKGAVTICHVGDSRAYLIRNGLIRQLTRDHTLAQAKLDQGVTPDDEERSVLVRSLGTEMNVAVDCLRESLVPGDRLVLCTDGLYDVVSDNEIGEIVSQRSAQRAVNQLIALANRRGGPDNISAIVLGYDTPPPSFWPTVTWTGNWKWALVALGALVFAMLLNLIVGLSRGLGTAMTATPAPTIVSSPTLAPLSLPTASAPAASAPTATSAPPATQALMTATPVSFPTGAASAAPLPGGVADSSTATPYAPATRIATRTPTSTFTLTSTPTSTFTPTATETATVAPAATAMPAPTPVPDQKGDDDGEPDAPSPDT